MPQRLKRLFDRIYEIDPTGLSGLVRLLVRAVRLIFLTPREFFADRGLHWAGSLSFSTLLALVPVGVLVLLVANFFDFDAVVTRFLIEQGLPDKAGQAGEAIEPIIQAARENAKSMGSLALAFLLFAAYGLFADLERTVASLWKTRRGRSFLGRLRAFASLFVIGPVLFGGSIWVTAHLQTIDVAVFAPAIGVLLKVLPFLVTWIAFFVLYSYLPTAKVRLRSAILAALVAGTGWEIAKRGFNLYIVNAITIDQFYGPVGIVPIALLWLYLTWIIVLFGVEMVYVDQNFDAIVHGVIGHGAERGAARELAAVRLVEEMGRARRAEEREAVTTELGLQAGIRPETAQELLEAMRLAELVEPVGRRRYRLARDDAAIVLADVLAAVRGPVRTAARDEPPTTLDRWFAEGESARRAALGAKTLADLLDASPASRAEDAPPAGKPDDGKPDDGKPDDGKPDGDDPTGTWARPPETRDVGPSPR